MKIKKKIVKGERDKNKNRVSFEDDTRNDEIDEFKEGTTFQIVVKEEAQKDSMLKDLVNAFHLENKRQPSIEELNNLLEKVN